MANELSHCPWCGSEVRSEHRPRGMANLCPECAETYEVEAHRPLHPTDIRLPHSE